MKQILICNEIFYLFILLDINLYIVTISTKNYNDAYTMNIINILYP